MVGKEKLKWHKQRGKKCEIRSYMNQLAGILINTT
jgi:hypothetical protein